MDYKPNYGTNPLNLRDGYQTLADQSPKRRRDNLVEASDVLVETDNGGFLGRTEQDESTSKDA